MKGVSQVTHFYPVKTVVETEECDALTITYLQKHTTVCGSRMAFRIPGAQMLCAPNTIKSLFTEAAHEANFRHTETTTEVRETL